MPTTLGGGSQRRVDRPQRGLLLLARGTVTAWGIPANVGTAAAGRSLVPERRAGEISISRWRITTSGQGLGGVLPAAVSSIRRSDERMRAR